jgi:hypothetical protein
MKSLPQASRRYRKCNFGGRGQKAGEITHAEKWKWELKYQHFVSY